MKGKVPKGKILVKRIDKLTKTAGGVIIPNAVEERQKRGEVVIGGDEVCVGDSVIFTTRGTEIELDGSKYLVIGEREVLYIE